MQPVSLYILTKDTAKSLPHIIAATKGIADEVIIIDSGSSDNTFQVAVEHKCRIFFKTFENFSAQRQFALSKCKNDWVLALDSDEMPMEGLVNEILNLKTSGFEHDAYAIKRSWMVRGKEVHAAYPVVCPDYPIRLFNRKKAGFNQHTGRVHEAPVGYNTLGTLQNEILHYAFESDWDIQEKLKLYTKLAAQDLVEQDSPTGIAQLWFGPLAAFIKWYFVNGGYKDGRTGFKLARYAMQFTHLKYQKAGALKQVVR